VAKTDEDAGQLIAIFHHLLGTLPLGAATIESRRTKNDDGTIVWLKPSNKRAAEFSAHLEDAHPSMIDVSFGSATTLELPWEANLPSDASFGAVLEIVRELASAVIAGRCEERFGFLRIRGTIRVDASHEYRCTSYFYPHRFPRTIRYEPYGDEPQPPTSAAGTPL
jgi:hypothetical protein